MKFEETDLESINDILMRADHEFISTRDNDKMLSEIMKSFSNDPDFHVFSLTNDVGEMVGFTSTFPNKHEGRISIGVTYIYPNMRRMGYGLEIRSRLMDWIKDSGYREVYAKTWSSNEALIKLNEKMGFRLAETVKNDRVNGDDTLKFLKEF